MVTLNLLVVSAFVCIIAVTPLLHAQNQTGFISIDCGSAPNSVYTEGKTGINYTSDESFTDAGVSHNISPDYISDTLERPFLTVRSFPEGSRNCYTLRPAIEYSKFLIRASFMYGNYDGKNETPRFRLLLGTDEWVTVEWEPEWKNIPNITLRKEIIHVPKRNQIDVCLENRDSGTPFISALELRPLLTKSYPIAADIALLLFYRSDIGSKATEAYRSKDDAYDRIWDPYTQSNWETIRTSHKISDSTVEYFNEYQPPSEVMQTAATPANGSNSLVFQWNSVDSSENFYIYFHFADVDDNMASNQSRIQNFYVNSKLWAGPTTLANRYSSYTRYSTGPLSGYQMLQISVEKTKDSLLPPILNAFELYTSKPLNQLFSNQEDVDAIRNVKTQYGAKRNWQGDPCVPKKYIWQGLDCSYPENDLPRITSLNLSSSGISGEISLHIFSLTSIQSLDLSNNNLTGSVPDFLAKLPHLSTLNLRGNNLHGSVPNGLLEKWKNHKLSLSVDGNPDLCISTSCMKKKHKSLVVPILASVLALCAFVALLATLFIPKARSQGLVWWRKNSGSHYLKTQRFSYSQVLKITNNFEKMIGQGGFGTVHHGKLQDKEVAVKMLSASSVQGYKQFHAEVELLLRVHHKNLTSLIGYCDDGTHVGLVYEFMANGNLDSHLIDEGSSSAADILSWEGRLQIATEAAQGLEYLHCGCKPPIIHRDVKPSNILLNENFQAKMADFGLSRIFPSESGSHVSTNIAGTPGYLDPEYYRSNRLTEKSDVYSFGVVLLQLVTGKRAIINSEDRTHIVRWVRYMLTDGGIERVVDRRLHGYFNINSAWRVVEIALACVSENSAKRPTMNQVVNDLNESLAIQIPPQNFGYESQPIDARPSSANMNMNMNLESVSAPVAR